jgi:uncharacterized protein (DUF58 family)
VKPASPRRIAKPALVACLGAVLYLIATNSGAGWIYVVAAATAAVVLVSAALPRWNVARVQVARSAPTVATAGRAIECSLEVRNTGRLARHLLEIEDRFAGDTGRAVAVRVESGGHESVGYTLENPRRGIYSGGEVVVTSGAPFGLFYARRRLRAASGIVVYPETFDVAGLPPSVAIDAERGDGSESSTLYRDHGGEFWGVREYRPGDPARLVAWKRSARSLSTGKLAVMELARETHPPFVVALNLDPSAPPEAREMVVSVGASLLMCALREGREVSAYAGPQEVPFPEEATPDGVLTWCAGLRPAPAPDPGGASVEVRPSTRWMKASTRRGQTSPPPGAGEARAVVLVSCRDFAGPGAWMSPQEERDFIDGVEAHGRPVTLVGRGFDGPLRFR